MLAGGLGGVGCPWMHGIGRVVFAWVLAAEIGMSNGVGMQRCVDLSSTRLAFVPSRGLGSRRGSSSGLCEWVEKSSVETVAEVWGEIISELEGRREITDYHLSIIPSDALAQVGAAMGLGDVSEAPFLVVATHSIPRTGPYRGGPCMSCDLNTSIAEGVWHQRPPCDSGENNPEECEVTTQQTLIGGEEPGFRCSFDGKARDMLVVTPERHIERLHELSPEEMYGLWRSVAGALREAGKHHVSRGGLRLGYETIVVNQGAFRNLAHLHVKVWLPSDLFKVHRQAWPEEMRRTFMLCDAMFGRYGKKSKKKALQKAPPCGHGAVIIDRLPPGTERGKAFQVALDRCTGFGEVIRFRVNGRVGSAICCGVVYFETQSAAAKAIASLHAAPFGATRRLRVEWASPCYCGPGGDDACGEDSLVY